MAIDTTVSKRKSEVIVLLIMYFLSQLNINDTAEVNKISADAETKRRMADLGIINGTVVQCILKRKRGGIAAYSIRGSTIALRNEDAEKITVTKPTR